MQPLSEYLSSLFSLSFYQKSVRSFNFWRRRILQKYRLGKGMHLSISFVAILFIGLLISVPQAPANINPLLVDKLHDSWLAEPERVTKDCKRLAHLSKLKINIQPLSDDKLIVYAKPPSAVIPAALVLELQQHENMVEGRIFRAIRQSDSVNFNMILSENSNKLTLAFALEEGPTTGEYVLSFLRHEGENNDLFSF